ncbi:hypothetical protein [Priestia megaterium]
MMKNKKSILLLTVTALIILIGLSIGNPDGVQYLSLFAALV